MKSLKVNFDEQFKIILKRNKKVMGNVVLSVSLDHFEIPISAREEIKTVIKIDNHGFLVEK
jgi:hypothetical protein